jgi:hypothetical protein
MCHITKLKNKLNPGTLVVSSFVFIKKPYKFSSTIHGNLFSFAKEKKSKEKKRKWHFAFLY